MWKKLKDKSIPFPALSTKVLVTNENIDWYNPSKYSLIEVGKLLDICDDPYCQWTHWMEIPPVENQIDEVKLDKLAREYLHDEEFFYSNEDKPKNLTFGDILEFMVSAFKGGFHKAKEN